MKSKKQKFKVNPTKEVISMMARLVRVGIDPGETVPRRVQWWRYSDIGSGTFESRLHRHDGEHEE